MSNQDCNPHHHQGIFSFNGLESSHQEQSQQHIAHQIRRDKHRIQSEFELSQNPLVSLGEESAGVFSEMFNFQSSATELLENQISQNLGRSSTVRRHPSGGIDGGVDWYGQRQQVGLGPLLIVDDNHQENVNNNNDADRLSDGPHHHHHEHQQQQQISRINGDSSTAVAAMQLFLLNPRQNENSSSPSPSSIPPPRTTSYMLPFETSQFSPWPNQEVFQGKGLSLSLSSSKAEELRMGDEGNNSMLFFNQETNGGSASSNSTMHTRFKNLLAHYQQQATHFQNQQQQLHHQQHPLGVVDVLRNSRYSRATQELLEEFCNVGREHPMMRMMNKKNKLTNPNSSNQHAPLPLSAADRIEHQRRKIKLLSMLDEVDRRYTHYCEQMQTVVNSFDLVMGYEAAVPYTSLAQKAMSRHFRCLKEALTTQLKHSYEVLGEKDVSATSGLTKGETPRLKLLEQRLRQQRGFNQMGMVEQEAWRPQRGLPERSVNVLRAWLFEHFLDPYPSYADKHLLARQTGLSRNQVSNWFINARVRLWKPMVEEMYQQESKEKTEEETESNRHGDAKSTAPHNTTTTTTSPAVVDLSTSRRHKFDEFENDHSLDATNRQPKQQEPMIHCFSTTTSSSLISPISSTTITTTMPSLMQSFPDIYDAPRSIHGADFAVATTSGDIGSTLIKFGTSPGKVSLTLGLRHTGDLPDNHPFSVRDFGSC